MSPVFTNPILSELRVASEWDDICGLEPEEHLINNLDEEVSDFLEEWTSDEDADINIMDFDEQIESNFFAKNMFGDEPPSEQLDSMDFDFDSDEYFTRSSSPVSSQDFPFADNQYREAFKNLSNLMKLSQESRESLKLKSPVQKASKHWEERSSNINTMLSSIEKSTRQIQQTYYYAVHP